MADESEYMVDIAEVTGEELDEPVEAWVSILVEQGTSLTIHPDFVGDDETIEEYVEGELELLLDDVVREIADGISEGDMEIDSVQKEDI